MENHMSLIQEVNEHAKLNEQEVQTTESNIAKLTENINESQEFITEAITQWLSKVTGVVGKGNLDPSKAKSVAEILGAVTALGSDDIASAFDDKGDLGSVLYSASSSNPQESNAALKRLREIGRHESAKSFTAKATQAMSDPKKFAEYVTTASNSIDRVMRTKMAHEKNNSK